MSSSAHRLALRPLRPLSLCRPTQARRTLFSLPDFSSLSPFPIGGPEEHYHERKILPYTRRQLYNIVADVNSYPSFVPYCTAAKIVSSHDNAPRPSATDGRSMAAELTVGFGAFTESYTSIVTCRPYDSVEAVASSSTPLFTSLSTAWRFQPASPCSPHLSPSGQPHRDGTPEADGGPTLVTLDLAYAFANPVHAAVSKAFFGKVSKMMVDAFELRCSEIYGRSDS